MARDLETLIVSLDADITRLTKQLSRAGVNLDDFAKDADKKADAAKKAINKHLGNETGSGGGLNFVQIQELGHAARATFESLAAGASPLRVLAQEGVKASAAIGPGGLSGLAKQLGTSLGAVLTPARLAAGGVLAVGAASLYAYSEYEDAQQAIKVGLSGIGQASHATIGDIEDIGDKVSATSRISVGAAKEIATAIAATGKVDVSRIAGIANLARGYGVLTGKSTAEAGQDLAKIFADPAKGAVVLNERLGALDGATLSYIRRLSEAGDTERAVDVLRNAVQPDIQKATDNIGLLARSYERLKTGASGAVESVGAGVSSIVDPTKEQQLADLKARRAQQAQTADSVDLLADAYSRLNKTGPQGKGAFPLNTPSGVPGGADALDAEIKKLEEEIATSKRLAQVEADRVKARVASVRAESAVEEADPLLAQIEQLEGRIKTVRQDVENAKQGLSLPAAGGFDHEVDAISALEGKLQALKRDYEAGGTAAAQALRNSDFNKSIAGLSSYERGLREVNHQFDQLIENARRSGDVQSAATIKTLEAARGASLDAYKRDSVERAKASTIIPGDFANVVIGTEGNNAAKNPNSSASGIGQFINSTFIDQYRKQFGDLASTMNDAAILQLKSDVEVNKRLIDAYARENAVKLQNAGFDATSANLYLAHNYGSTGAINLLKADPNASAAGVLGASAVSANPNIKGLSAQGVIDEAARRSQRYSSAGTAQQGQITAERAASETYDKSAAAAARLSSIQEQLNADREKGGELGRQFATAQDLDKASSDHLTPALAAQRKAILDLADARAKATTSTLSTGFQTDQQNALDALGRTQEQQSIFTQAKSYGAAPGTPDFDKYAQGLERIRELSQAKETGSSFAKSLTDDLIAGTSAADALKSAVTRLLQSLANSAIDSIASTIFKAGTAGSGGGIIGSLLGAVKLAGGGRVVGPGSGTSDSIPALLSHGEFVMNAASSQKYGPLLAALNSGTVRRFAAGGAVSMPASSNAVPSASASGGGSISMVVDVRGATGNEEVRRMVSQGVQAGVQAGMTQVSTNVPAMIGDYNRRGTNASKTFRLKLR